MRDDHGGFWNPELRPAESAAPAEQFSIWAMRTWAGAFPELDSMWPELVAGFKRCASPAALESFHRFCSVSLAAAGCGAGVACIHCPSITPVEETLLDVLKTAANSDVDETETAMRRIMPPAAARIAAPHAIRFARSLEQAGLAWPPSASEAEAELATFDWSTTSKYSERVH